MNANDNSSAHISSEYDAEVRRTIPNYDLFHEETVRLVRSAGMKPRLWLDTGCGTGNLVLRARKDFPDTKFLLADPSEEMLAQAKKKLDVPNVRFLQPGETQFLVRQNQEFDKQPDVITAIQAHHYLDKETRMDATKTCFELLGQDGMFITFENVTPTTAKGIEIGKAGWKEFQVKNGRTPEEAEKHIRRFGNDYHPITVEDHYFLYRVCGFRVVELFWYSYMQAGFYCIK
jgi:tRNA (cmo5U34)-methyltransferase